MAAGTACRSVSATSTAIGSASGSGPTATALPSTGGTCDGSPAAESVSGLSGSVGEPCTQPTPRRTRSGRLGFCGGTDPGEETKGKERTMIHFWTLVGTIFAAEIYGIPVAPRMVDHTMIRHNPFSYRHPARSATFS